MEVVDGESVYVGGVLAAGSFGSEMGSRAAEVLSKTSLGEEEEKNGVEKKGLGRSDL